MEQSVSKCGNMDKAGFGDSRVQRTLQKIQKAFHDLVLSNDYEQITVSALCKAAHIGRKTFYAHFTSLDDLMEKTLLRMTEDYVRRIKGLRVPEDTGEITRQFYLYSEEQGRFYEKLVCSDGYQKMGGKMLKAFVAETWQDSPWYGELSPQKQKLLLCFIYSSGAALYRQWVSDGRKIPIEEMIGFANDLLAKGFEGL